MKINAFEMLSNLFTEDDYIIESDSSLNEFVEDLQAVRSSILEDLSSGTFRYDVVKSKEGKTLYRGIRNDGMHLSILLMKKNNSTVTVSEKTADTSLDTYFRSLDYSKLDPFGDYKLREVKVEEDGYVQMIIEELLLNGEAVAQRVINHRNRDGMEDNEKRALLCLSSYALGGMEVMYDRNSNVLDLDTVGDIRLRNLNVDGEELKENIKYYIMDLVLKEYFRLERLLSINKAPQK